MTIPSVLVVAMVRDAVEGDAVVVVFLAVMALVLVGLAGDDEILLLAVAGALFAPLPPFIIYRMNQRVTGAAAFARKEDNIVAVVAPSTTSTLQ